MKNSMILATVLLLSPALKAQETPPSFETVVEDVVFNTSSKVVLDEKLIKDSRAPDITTLLSSQANITIANRPFQPNSIFIRGSDAAHILILVDGIPYYDSSSAMRSFNLNSMDIKSIRRIEIIKGAQTTLYGGQALGGVIKIETLPQTLESKNGLQVRAGQFDLSDASVSSVIPTVENQGVFVHVQAGQSRTESPVLDSKKMYDHSKANGEAAYMWRGPVQAYLKAQYQNEKNDSPTSSFMTNKIVDADDFVQKSEQTAVHSSVRLNEILWNPQLTLGAQNSKRSFDQPINATNPTAVVGEDYGANLRSARVDLTPWKSDLFGVHLGLSYLYEDLSADYIDGRPRIDQFAEQRGLFAKVDYQLSPSFQLSVGGRAENWADRDPVSTYQVGLTAFQNTKLEFATGYKVPSLFQLYSTYGNSDLKEEKSTQYSVTQDIPLSENQNISVTAFSSEYSNLIVIQGSATGLRYANVNKSKTQGVEFAYSVRPSESSSLLLTYGYQEPKDTDNNRWLSLRPLVNGSVRYTHYWNEHAATLEVLAAGERIDMIGRSSPTVPVYGSIPGYATANAAYTYKWNEELSLYTRLNNLLNTRQQESFSYYSQSFNAYVGADYWF